MTSCVLALAPGPLTRPRSQPVTNKTATTPNTRDQLKAAKRRAAVVQVLRPAEALASGCWRIERRGKIFKENEDKCKILLAL